MVDNSKKLHALKINRGNEVGKAAGSSNWPKILGFTSLGALIAVALWFFWPGQDEIPETTEATSTQTTQTENSGTPPTQTGTGGAGSLEILNASGYITARRKATVSAEITGRVKEVLIEEGTAVEAGQIVALLDDTLAQVDLDLAKASVRSAEARIKEISADLEEAKRVLARTEELVKTQNASQAALTRAQATVDTLQSSYDRAGVEIEIANLQVARQQETVDKHVIRAPFAGVVVDKNAQPGEMISPISAGGGFTRTGICTLVDMDSLEIEVDVNESYIGRVFPGQKVNANLDSYPDWDIPAQVIAVVPTANRDKATVKVRIGLGVKDPRILPDMGVKVAFLRDQD